MAYPSMLWKIQYGPVNHGECQEFLEESRGIPWGFDVYRTVYTAESETQWIAALEKLHSYVAKSVYHDVDETERRGYAPENPQLNHTVMETYCQDVIQGPEFDGATDDFIRSHARASYEKRQEEEAYLGLQRPRSIACIVIDEQSLKSIIDGTPPSNEIFWYGQVRPAPIAEVKMLDTMYDPHDDDLEYPDTFHGWIRVPCNRIWGVYSGLFFELFLDRFAVPDGVGGSRYE